jgi:gliding motility-associated-like protein
VPASSHTRPIVISGTPQKPTVTPAYTEVCEGSSVFFTATGSGTVRWYADPNLTDLLQSGNQYTFTPTGTRTYFIQSSEGNCKSDTAQAIAKSKFFPPKPKLGTDTSLCPGETLLLNPGNYEAYQWQDGSVQPSFRVNQSGLYTVTVGTGCQSSDSIRVVLLGECSDIYFPGAFTPNGDGKNEGFGPVGNLFLVKNYELSIFNRYGQRVFISRNPPERWDGGNSDKRSGVETYTWMARYLFRNREVVRKGTVLLIK